MPKKRGDRPNVDSLLPDVDDEMRHDGGKASQRHDGLASDRDSAMSPQRHNANEAGEGDEPASGGSATEQSEAGNAGGASAEESRSELERQLEVLMSGPARPYADAKPDLPERTHGYVSSEVDRSLEQAASVLKNRYGKGFSKSLVVDYALRVALWDLRENAEESRLVEWLDRTLDRSE
jgi:hypothetical protein